MRRGGRGVALALGYHLTSEGTSEWKIGAVMECLLTFKGVISFRITVQPCNDLDYNKYFGIVYIDMSVELVGYVVKGKSFDF